MACLQDSYRRKISPLEKKGVIAAENVLESQWSGRL